MQFSSRVVTRDLRAERHMIEPSRVAICYCFIYWLTVLFYSFPYKIKKKINLD
jgi:hypothetical protein